MKKILLFNLVFCLCISVKAQSKKDSLIGKWHSLNDTTLVLLFTSTIERKYHLKKDVKKIPIYNIEEAKISVNGNNLNERQHGGGGINNTYKFDISNDTLFIIYKKNSLKYSFKRISDNEFFKLTGRSY